MLCKNWQSNTYFFNIFFTHLPRDNAVVAACETPTVHVVEVWFLIFAESTAVLNDQHVWMILIAKLLLCHPSRNWISCLYWSLFSKILTVSLLYSHTELKKSLVQASKICHHWLQYSSIWFSSFINTLKLRQNCLHFADSIFKCIFLNENVSISPKFLRFQKTILHHWFR